MLPNLPSELDIVVLRLSNQVIEGDPRFQRQFWSDFWVCKGCVITWLRYLKDHHPNYCYITISLDCIDALLVDGDVSLSFTAIVDHEDSLVQDQSILGEPVIQDLASAELPPPNSQSMVPNLNITTIEVDLILNELVGRNSPHGLPAPSIRSTPIDEVVGKDRIFAMAFPTLYPTGLADFNTSRLRKVDLNDYAQHLMCFSDGRFRRHPR